MSCHRARRELLWLVRFGPFDAGSAPHLDHLAGCRACRDEVGLDRALVRQLRTALADRVADAAPSPSAWEGVLDRMRQPEPRLARMRTWPMRFAAGLRAGTAMAGASLALVLALNLEVVPMAPIQPDDEPRPAAVAPAWAGEIPPFVDVAPAVQPEAIAAADDRTASTVTVRQFPPAEQLPLPRRPIADAESEPAVDGTGDAPAEPADEWQILVRLVPSDAAGMAPTMETTSREGGTRPAPAPAPELAPAGSPS